MVNSYDLLATRAVWRGPARATPEEAQTDFDRLKALIELHAPDLAPPSTATEPERRIPGSDAVNQKEKG